jgi:hypothetical protein
VGFENLTKTAQYIGADSLVAISGRNIPAAILAITSAAEPRKTAELIKYYVCSARIAGEKITPDVYEERFNGNLYEAIEIFTIVAHAQYDEFFRQGLVRDSSPSE